MTSANGSRRLKFERLESRLAPGGLLLLFPFPDSTWDDDPDADTSVAASSVAEPGVWEASPISAVAMRQFLERETRDLQQEVTRRGQLDPVDSPDAAHCERVDRFMETVR